MTIEKVISYAREKGLPERTINALIAQLHPDKNGNLRPDEYFPAVAAICNTADSIEATRFFLEEGRKARRSANYTRVSTEEQADGDSLQDQKDATAEYAISNGMKPIVVDYRAGYDFVTNLQNELAGQHHDAEIGCLDYRVVKALAATYELQDYLADRIAKAVANGELDPDPEE